ncbi:hypothetical protein G7046_g5521 [Stylonectria norvegica]|nr:hypothetical protein G7046_g5521 [Stylonectria norvegica]
MIFSGVTRLFTPAAWTHAVQCGKTPSSSGNLPHESSQRRPYLEPKHSPRFRPEATCSIAASPIRTRNCNGGQLQASLFSLFTGDRGWQRRPKSWHDTTRSAGRAGGPVPSWESRGDMAGCEAGEGRGCTSLDGDALPRACGIGVVRLGSRDARACIDEFGETLQTKSLEGTPWSQDQALDDRYWKMPTGNPPVVVDGDVDGDVVEPPSRAILR